MRLLLQLCMMFSLLSCANSGKLTSLDEFNLKGNVSSIKVITYEAESKFGEIVKGDIDYSGNYQYEFNDNKMTTVKTTFDRRGNIDGKDIYAYNNNNGLTTVSTYDSDGDLDGKIIFEYIDNILVSQNFYDADGELENKIEFENNGKNITKGKYVKSENDFSYWTNTWNGDILVESIGYNKDGGIESKSTYTRDGKLSKISLDSFEISLKYNDSKDIISYINAEPSDITSFFYNEGKTYYCEYEYDSHDNWVKRTSYLGETRIPDKIVERNIVYFN